MEKGKKLNERKVLKFFLLSFFFLSFILRKCKKNCMMVDFHQENGYVDVARHL